MTNTTITLDKQTLEQARKHAAGLGVSFNAWVKKIIHDAIRPSPKRRMQGVLDLADKIAGNSHGQKWTKDEIYER